MRKLTEKDVENLIQDSVFDNTAHKKALRGRLFDGSLPLSPEELESVAGGTAIPDQRIWEPWPDEVKKEK